MEFTEFNLNEQLLNGLQTAGYTTCTEVQEQVLKISQDGSDLYVQSQTGTGKTAAYLVAIIQEMLSKEENKGKKALILVPTRELAVQVEEEAKVLVGNSGLKAFSVYGGVGYEKQIAALKKGVDIIIGTPGRVIDLQEGKNLDLSNAYFTVIDEADRMFDMGFYPDLRKILKMLPETEQRQTMLFSATLNSYVKNLAWEYTRDPKEIEIKAENITVSEIDQSLLHVSSTDKMRLLIGVLKNEKPASAIIFCNTKRSCEVVAKRLQMNEISCEFLIGDLPQSKRLSILKEFKAGKINMLVATDVAARGIDVSDLAMVINYDLPVEAENYVHRIGRTARAGKSGKAYTFCSEQDVYNLPAIERYIEMSIPASVAFEDQMAEDKSAGVYIKTEDWRGDEEDSHGGYRKGNKGSKGSHSRNDYHKDNNHKSYDNHGEKKNSHKDGYKKSGSKDFNRNKKPYIDPEKLAGLSYEERMKLYKDAYSGGNKASSGNKASPKSENKNYKNKKGGNYKKSYDQKGSKKSYNNTKNNNKKYNNSKKVQAAPEKKSFWQKVKAFFTK